MGCITQALLGLPLANCKLDRAVLNHTLEADGDGPLNPNISMQI